MKIHPQVSE